MRPPWEKFQFWQSGILHFSAVFGLFLGVKETILSSPLFCAVDIVLCLLNLLYDHVINFGDCTCPQDQETTSFWTTRRRNNINAAIKNVNATSFTHICFFQYHIIFAFIQGIVKRKIRQINNSLWKIFSVRSKCNQASSRQFWPVSGASGKPCQKQGWISLTQS